jgi:pilus assembly protein CpaB
MPSKLATTSIALGVLALIVLRLHLAHLEARITGGAMTRVLMLTADLPAGASITRDVLASRDLPQAFRESRHIAASELEDVVGAQLAVSARANETLGWTDLTTMRPRLRQLSNLIPHGMRAMTLGQSGLAPEALLRPGDRVDVLRLGASGGAEVVLQDVVVLAVGDDLGGARVERSTSSRTGAITLSVTVEQSRVLAQAEQLGKLRLVLRNPDDIALGSAAQAATSAEAAR